MPEMFEVSDKPRVFALPPGVDFARAFVDGLVDAAAKLSPTDFARVEIFVNTARMQRRIRDVFDTGPARLLPKVQLITNLSQSPIGRDLSLPVSPLRRRLEISQLVGHLLEAEPNLAPQSARFDLSDSIAALMDEMHGEGVDPYVLERLDVGDMSEHWERSLKFLRIVQRYFDDRQGPPDKEARQRIVIERMAENWRARPPSHPIIVAGSTGSRGATALLMDAVSQLPQGALVLPGFDFDQPTAVWETMHDAMTGEDHPQFRYSKLMQRLDLRREDIRNWGKAKPPVPPRSRLMSLALRPAPVTDHWRRDGPKLDCLHEATSGVTLVEAPSPRIEAEAIAIGIREAIGRGATTALISPDRTLTRQVAAALDRWDIVADDSAGQPLSLSPPGRLLMHCAELLTKELAAEPLLVTLKHPLVATGSEDRGSHLRFTRELELYLRRFAIPFPNGDTIRKWADGIEQIGDDQRRWAGWLSAILDGLSFARDTASLSTHLARHVALTSQFAAGADADGSGSLWDEAAGRKACSVIKDVEKCADASGPLSPSDYLTFFGAVLAQNEVRNPDTGRPDVLILGTLEARVNSADLVILAGLNEGVWPETPAPDPWLNRQMRLQAGLLLPERRIGLSAHDFQQAVNAPTVWLTRSIRSDDSETVPSRWVNRVTNLLAGLPETGGSDALENMRARGRRWIDAAERIDQPTETEMPAARPSPRPPVKARPVRLSVTQIKTLIRDPYAIYARNVLRLDPLDPLSPEPDAALRGILVHRIMERFVFEGPLPDAPNARDALMAVAHEVMHQGCPWPTIRQLWIARFEKVVDWFLKTEIERRALGVPAERENLGELELPGLGFTLRARADRFDTSVDGGITLYDYKSGKPPTTKQQLIFDKQLLLTAAMAARGAFKALGTREVSSAAFVGLGSKPEIVTAPFDKETADEAWEGFIELIRAWQDPRQGYTSRRMLQKITDSGAYDHLARYGEWSIADDPVPEDLK